ncbi:efflux RND transporter periplasmic adaptor subunit [Tahibacter amnicola]|uniref:Efflux RND transporter periplasmic adaptor subunit n=1 Tax=Tahibacter amnicola TaxID=2976241 RepID=A0ABY6BES5_9GAMM|nr:efflux RND transporter periplasmic adaptor subunit [Tahibacter amnicola]UXI68244.1 efflux RND transporter periplasmic adaptor subunit [Tahibacter amnicola]
MKTVTFSFLIASLAAVPFAFTQAQDKAPEKAPAPPPATVAVGEATTTALAPTRWVPGSVVSREDAKIAGVAAGRVMEIAEVGTVVKRGDRLAKLDDVALRLRLESAKASAGRAKAQRDLASTQATRLAKLAPGNAVAQTQLDEANATLESASQELARADAERRSIEHALSETDIRAPFDGVVSERFVQRGEYLQTGGPVVHLVNTENLEARVQAPLDLAPHLRAGQELQIRLKGASQPASVRAIVPVGDERSRQFELRVSLPEEFALVGTAVEVALPESQGTAGLTVPRDALVLRESHTYVMRVKPDNTAEQVEVKAGVARDARVEVSGALAAGDRVVVRGAERLRAGQSVRIVGS